MKLISICRIAHGANEAYLKLKNNAYFGSGFESGVYFAENELINMAIDFKIFCDKHKAVNTDSCRYLTEKLFEKFIEERKKTI